MKRTFTVLALFFMISAVSFACRCQMDEAKLFYFVEAKYVFRAEVKSASDCGDNNKYTYELDVEDVYKGDLEGDELTVYTDCITSCAFKLEEDKTYIFFTDLINNNIGFCEYKIEKKEAEYKSTQAFLNKIKNTRLDFLTIQDSKKNKLGELQIREGKLDGLVKIYYPNKTVRLRGMFIKGVPSGGFEITLLRRKKKDFWQGDYENGERVGMWIHITSNIDESGKKDYEHVFYEEGEIVERHLMDQESQIERYAPPKKEVKEVKE